MSFLTNLMAQGHNKGHNRGHIGRWQGPFWAILGGRGKGITRAILGHLGWGLPWCFGRVLLEGLGGDMGCGVAWVGV